MAAGEAVVFAPRFSQTRANEPEYSILSWQLDDPEHLFCLVQIYISAPFPAEIVFDRQMRRRFRRRGG